MVSQCIRGSGKNLSPYLQEAAGYATAGTQMIMALDMADVAALGAPAPADPQPTAPAISGGDG